MRNWFDELKPIVQKYADKNGLTLEQAVGKMIRKASRDSERPRKRSKRGRYRGRSVINPSVRPLIVYRNRPRKNQSEN